MGFSHCSVLVVAHFDSEALLHQEMQDLKRRRDTLKRQCKDAAKEQKLLDAKRRRLLKASWIQARSCLLSSSLMSAKLLLFFLANLCEFCDCAGCERSFF